MTYSVAPDDPGPARPPAPAKAPSQRITTPPWRMPARATCKAHQVFVDGCKSCDDAITARAEIRAGQHRSHVRSLTGAPRR